MTTYEQLKLIYIGLRKTKDHKREIFREGEYKWVIGHEIAKELNFTTTKCFFDAEEIAEKNFLFGLEVEIDYINPKIIKLYEDITNKILTKVNYKKPHVIEYKGCRNCKFQPGPLLMCNWMKEQKTVYLKCPRWEPKEEQEGSTAEEQEEKA